MKKLIALFVAILFVSCCFFTISVTNAVAAKKVVMRSVSFLPPSKYYQNYPILRLKEAVENRIGDKVEIKIVGSMRQVVAVPEAVTSVGKGVFDLVYTPLAYHTGVIPELTIYTVLRPWAWRDCYKVPGFMELFRKAVGERVNVHVLGGPLGDGPMYVLTAKKEVHSVADMRGLKFRAPGPIGSRIAKRLNSAAVSMPLHEVYEAMQRGIVDGGFINAVTVADFKLHEFAKYMTAPLMEFKQTTFINKDKWNSLDPEIRKVMEEEWDHIIYEHYGLYNGLQGKNMAYFKTIGMKIFDMPEAEMKKFNKARVDDVEEWYLKKCPKYGPQLSEMLRPYF
ncbi:MAG: TRAP transporter substrate-binding protein DctP [Deltaproteobacteria bacterium]|nr:TRAP transporter substrate-binding protein DctP [Deltaproteobacteria bacterium]MBW2339366.1 TRAP transporter substrate-binding protein DctP [Deltaproteobacteria bacterium]